MAASTAVIAVIIIGILVLQASLGPSASGAGAASRTSSSSTTSSTSKTSSSSTTSTTSTTSSSSTTTSTSSTGPISQFAPILVGPLQPYSATYDPSNKLVYIAEANSPYFNNLEGITAINGSDWTKTFPTCPGAENGPQSIAFDPANNYLYVTCVYPGNVAVFNPATGSLVTTVTAGSSPWNLAYDPASQDMYVSNYASNSVSVISSSTNNVVATLTQIEQPTFIVYSPANSDLYVVNSAYPYGITVVNGVTNAVISTIQGEAGNLIYDPANQGVYASVVAFVSGTQTAEVYAINTSDQVAATIVVSGIGFPATDSGGSLVFDSGNNNVFVGTDPGTTGPNVVTEISSSTNKVIGSVNIPADCIQGGCYDLTDLTYDSANQDIYISGPGQYVYIVSSSLSVIQTIPLTIIASSSTSDFPAFSIFDPANNEVFVLCDNYAEIVIPLSS
ncbi:MAG: YncE family protein [Thaumarchaeota archaeon]|nr:YncE family protein [Nitrososphaerota archaeon]